MVIHNIKPAANHRIEVMMPPNTSQIMFPRKLKTTPPIKTNQFYIILLIIEVICLFFLTHWYMLQMYSHQSIP